MNNYWEVLNQDWKTALRKPLRNNPYLQVLKINKKEYSLPELAFNTSLTDPNAEELTIPDNTSDSKFTFVLDVIKNTPSINVLKWEGNSFGSHHFQTILSLLAASKTLSFHVKIDKAYQPAIHLSTLRSV